MIEVGVDFTSILRVPTVGRIDGGMIVPDRHRHIHLLERSVVAYLKGCIEIRRAGWRLAVSRIFNGIMDRPFRPVGEVAVDGDVAHSGATASTPLCARTGWHSKNSNAAHDVTLPSSRIIHHTPFLANYTP